MIAIVHYGMGNVGSIANMLKKIGVESQITSDPTDIAKATKLILPGVGAFDEAISNLRRLNLIPALDARVREGIPVMGICLGMQLLTERSEEGGLPGLGWLPAETLRLQLEGTDQRRLPHMGWNTINICREHPLLQDLLPAPRFYFVHSYHVQCRNPDDVLAMTSYGTGFHSIVAKNNVMGTQFHPEKSHAFGLKILANFAAL